MARLFGLTFAVRCMESGECEAVQSYTELAQRVPGAIGLAEVEKQHEQSLGKILHEDKLNYIGSMVLGLNDALVELSGTLVGMTFGLNDTPTRRTPCAHYRLCGDTFNGASREYLSAHSEGRPDAFKACCYSGTAYLFVTISLAIPYLVMPADRCYWALGWMMVNVVAIIAGFNYYISIV